MPRTSRASWLSLPEQRRRPRRRDVRLKLFSEARFQFRQIRTADRRPVRTSELRILEQPWPAARRATVDPRPPARRLRRHRLHRPPAQPPAPPAADWMTIILVPTAIRRRGGDLEPNWSATSTTPAAVTRARSVRCCLRRSRSSPRSRPLASIADAMDHAVIRESWRQRHDRSPNEIL